MTQDKTNKVLNVPPLRFPEFSGEWEKCKLGEIMSYSKDRVSTNSLSDENYVSTENMLPNFGGICRANNVPSNNSAIVYHTRNILLSNIRPYLKKVWLANNNGGCSSDVFVLKADNEQCDSDFLFYLVANDNFISYVMSGAKGVKMPRGDKEQIKKYLLSLPLKDEQHKIAEFLCKLDARISTQIRVIEDLQTLKKALIERSYNVSGKVHKIGELIEKVSERSKLNVYPVLSVNNRLGFIEQADQFEDRTVASDDTSNYKVVSTNDFAYNPARINVGSIARLKERTNGIVSPMYVCFHTKGSLLPEYMEHFFDTTYFKHEMFKRLEGSVRLCLSYEGLCNISMYMPSIDVQKKLSNRLSAIEQKIQLESKLLENFKSQKMYLLQQMFI